MAKNDPAKMSDPPDKLSIFHSGGSGGGSDSGGGGGGGGGGGASRVGPLSPHSVPGVSGGSDSGTARRHHSTSARTDPSAHPGCNISRRSSSAASVVSSKSVSPNLSPKSSLSTSSSSGSLKLEMEGRGGGGGGGGGGAQRRSNDREREKEVRIKELHYTYVRMYVLGIYTVDSKRMFTKSF